MSPQHNDPLSLTDLGAMLGVNIVAGLNPVQAVTVGPGGVGSIDITPPTDKTHLLIMHQMRSNDASFSKDLISLRFNSDSGANYRTQEFWGTASAASSLLNTSNNMRAGYAASSLSPAGEAGSGVIFIPFYRQTDWNKSAVCLTGIRSASGAPDTLFSFANWGVWLSAAAITVINLLPNNGSLWAQNSRVSAHAF